MDHWRIQRGNLEIPNKECKWKHDDPNPMGCSKSSSKKAYSYIILSQETRKISNKQPKPTPKQLEKEQTKLKVSRREKNIKIRAEINEI